MRVARQTKLEQRLNQMAFRERRRRKGFRPLETHLHLTEIEMLDGLKVRLALANRSEAIRAVIAAVDFDKITPEAVKFKEMAAWDDETPTETP